MENIKQKFFTKLKNNKSEIIFCFLSVFICGLVAHAFIFFNASFTHDSLNEFNAISFGNELRLKYGRVFVPIYRAIFKTPFALPWLTGFLALIWISISLFLIIKTFNIKSKTAVFFLGGVMSTNLTVTAVAATFIHDFDCDMFALLLSVIAFFVWYRYKYGFLWGSIFICASLGLYQSYISSAITLIIIFSIFSLVNNNDSKAVTIKGLKGALMLFIGGIMYWIFAIIVPIITNTKVATKGYNTIYKTRSFPSLLTGLFSSYRDSLSAIISSPTIYNKIFMRVICSAVFIITLIIMIYLIRKNIKSISGKILSVILILILPWGMNTSQILSGGAGHDLMRYAVWFIYLIAILGVLMFAKTSETKSNRLKIVSQLVVFTLIAIILWSNIQLSNTVYMKKDIECESNKILFTRVLNRMESTYGYVPGEIPVAFIGRPGDTQNRIPDFDSAYDVIGCESPFALGAADHTYYQAYFDYVLTYPIILTDEKTRKELSKREDIKHMPSFPMEGCVQIIDGTLIVKLG